MIDQDKLIQLFSNYLVQEGASDKTKKNYVADLIDFFSWLSKTETGIEFVTASSIQNYQQDLLSKQKTIATINRRLSTLRVFFRCCQQAQLIANNPMENLHNLENTPRTLEEHQELFTSWHDYLSHKGLNKYSISDHVNVVGDFLEWLKSNQKI